MHSMDESYRIRLPTVLFEINLVATDEGPNGCMVLLELIRSAEDRIGDVCSGSRMTQQLNPLALCALP